MYNAAGSYSEARVNRSHVSGGRNATRFSRKSRSAGEKASPSWLSRGDVLGVGVTTHSRDDARCWAHDNETREGFHITIEKTKTKKYDRTDRQTDRQFCVLLFVFVFQELHNFGFRLCLGKKRAGRVGALWFQWVEESPKSLIFYQRK